MLRSKFVKFLLSILKRQADSSPNFVSLFNFIKDNSSVLFLAWAIYTFRKRSPLKSKLVKLLSAQVKICQILYVHFGTMSIPLQILHRSSVSWKITPLYFFSFSNRYFAQKKPIKVKISKTFECWGQNLSNSLCQFWKKVDSAPNFASLLSFMKVTLMYIFSFNNIYFAQKRPIKAEIFETFESSGQNLSDSLCQSWNDRSIPLQILHRSSLSWNITPAYFF